jgi:hypothetical protein
MNPRTVLWQSVATAALLSAMIVFADPLAAAWIAAIGVLAAVSLNASYARALDDRGRSRRRMVGDRWVARHIALGLIAPLLAAVAALVAGHDPRARIWGFTHNETAALLIIGASLLVIVLGSSLIDWYYIRPRIDGVVGAPPCRAEDSENGKWKRVTRRWYLHRGIATLAYMAFAIGVAVVVMIMLVREHPAAAAVVGGISGIAGLLLIFAGSYRSELPTVAKWVLSPAFALGADLTYEGYGGMKRGYVLHVAVPVVKLVPLDDHGRPTGVPFVERNNSRLAEADLLPRRTVACEKRCAGLNPECMDEDTHEKRRYDRKKHLLIL